jgi:3'(2'), 5'-bisphosphate nucleotidase
MTPLPAHSRADAAAPQMPLKPELGVAVEAARAAGAAAMRFYGGNSSRTKSDHTPVTDADHAANDEIVTRLREAFPDDAILSEESPDGSDRQTAQRVWIVDPLDGTREFVARNGEFSIMVGLVLEGAPVLGVVYLPDPDELFFATRGTGAWVMRGGLVEPLFCVEGRLASLRLVGSRSHAEPLLERIQDALGITDVEACGSVGVKCSRIAEGRRDVYVHPVPFLKEWDTCAPEVLLSEAGGHVSDCLGRPLAYNKRDPRQPHGIVACGAGCADFVMVRVRPLYEASRAGHRTLA